MEMRPDVDQDGGGLPPQSVPAWAGPFGHERMYRIDKPGEYRRGGLGVVFEAVLCSDTLGPDHVGTKVGLKQLTNIDDHRWARLEQRSPMLAKVNHPNLSKHLGVFMGPRPVLDGAEPEDDDPKRYIVHVWTEGKPLADAVQVGVGVRRILRWLRQMADALDVLHHHPAGPFAHRDLHPRNVIISPDDDAVIIDYDTVFAGARWTTTKNLVGSRFVPGPAANISPQAADRGALAKIALHSLASDGDGALEYEAVLKAARTRLLVDGIRPDAAVQLLEAAMAGRGPDTCTELIAELEVAIGERRRGLRRVLTAVGGRRSGDAIGGRRWPQVAVASIVVAAIVAVAGVVWMRDTDSAAGPLASPDTSQIDTTIPVDGSTISTSIVDVTTSTTTLTSTSSIPSVQQPVPTTSIGDRPGLTTPPPTQPPLATVPPPPPTTPTTTPTEPQSGTSTCRASTAASLISSNLVSNPSFENDQSGWGGLNSTRVRVPCQPAPHGSYAAKVGYRFDGTYEGQYIIGMSDPVVARTGGCYRATVWVAAASPSTIGKVLTLVIRERRDDGPKTFVELWYATVELRENFQAMTLQHAALNAGDLIDIYVERGEAVSGDAFYFDNASLVFSSC